MFDQYKINTISNCFLHFFMNKNSGQSYNILQTHVQLKLELVIHNPRKRLSQPSLQRFNKCPTYKYQISIQLIIIRIYDLGLCRIIKYVTNWLTDNMFKFIYIQSAVFKYQKKITWVDKQQLHSLQGEIKLVICFLHHFFNRIQLENIIEH